jgi:hypothetical protein
MPPTSCQVVIGGTHVAPMNVLMSPRDPNNESMRRVAPMTQGGAQVGTDALTPMLADRSNVIAVT